MTVKISTNQKEKIEIDGEVFALSRPKISQSEAFYEKIQELNDDQMGQFKALKDMICECGLPVEILEQLEMAHLEAIAEALTKKKH